MNILGQISSFLGSFYAPVRYGLLRLQTLFFQPRLQQTKQTIAENAMDSQNINQAEAFDFPATIDNIALVAHVQKHMKYEVLQGEPSYPSLTNHHRMFQTEELSDVEIHCGDKVWKVHKAVLASQCSFFSHALGGDFQVSTLPDISKICTQTFSSRSLPVV